MPKKKARKSRWGRVRRFNQRLRLSAWKTDEFDLTTPNDVDSYRRDPLIAEWTLPYNYYHVEC